MQRIDGRFLYSATDLHAFLECRRLSELQALVARKRLEAPPDAEQAEIVKRKGEIHEQRCLEELQSAHPGEVTCLARPSSGVEAYRAAEQRTLEAMRSGAKYVYQATFFDGQFLGHADFLQRVARPSDLGDWSYEVLDAKLALSAKPHFLIQLCNYSEHLQRLQGSMPERGSIVLGDGSKQFFRLHDYFAYYRHIKTRFLTFAGDPAHQSGVPQTYPFQCTHCAICAWDGACEQRRIDDDHLSLVAWIRQDQIAKLESIGIDTLAGLARAADAARPDGMNPRTFGKLRKQAQLQLRSRELAQPIYELQPHDPRTGFGLLPEPAPGDAYFDMEGDPMYEPGRGLEYLFGCWLPGDGISPAPSPTFEAFWAYDRLEEKRAFERFIDFIVARRRRCPTMHVYHYANYEKAAIRRLSQEHSTRMEEVDDLLRGEVLVDLYAVVRQSLMIGEDSYSIKRLERFYGMQRTTEVKKGDDSIVMFEKWRVERDPRLLQDIEEYNKDDCESTYLLHQWLLERRAEAIAALGMALPFRPVKSPSAPCHAPPFDGCAKCRKRLAEQRENERASALEHLLLRGILHPQNDDEYYGLSEAVRSRYVLGHLLSYHRREEKPVWWQFFDRCENADTLQEFDKEAIGGLEYLPQIAPYKLKESDKNVVYTYFMPEQRHKMERGDVSDPYTQKSAGAIVEIDEDAQVLRLKSGVGEDAARHITALIPGGPLSTEPQQCALTRIAQTYAEGALRRRYPATDDILSARAPRMTRSFAARTSHGGGPPTLQPDELSAATISAVAQSLDNSYLFIQGPPGSGKSTIGSQMICDLLHAGKRVGVMSTGHKAMHHLLHKVEACMEKRGHRFRGLYKHSGTSGGSRYESTVHAPCIQSVDKANAFDAGAYDLAGGTAWLFAREELTGAFDYLFIDEAGQVSLADALAVSACAKNVVLLGDPSQLAQVRLGRHARHADDSVLLHLLGEQSTVPAHRGIFLERSYRMHPAICAFISDAMYDGRLKAAPSTALHRVNSAGLTGSGLRFFAVDHTGNSSTSIEEADRIVAEAALLLGGTLVDSDGVERPLRSADIIVVTPYNAQRRLIARKMHEAGIDAAVGTVDKFQGQEAAVVFYSMATSSGEDVPRDVEFLFEQNRFNVAISRARAMSVLVCSPRLLDVPCRSTEQMALVNLLCAYTAAASEGHPLQQTVSSVR